MFESARLAVAIPAAYSPQTGAERLIAAGRVVLGGFSLLAIHLDPSQPAKSANTAHQLAVAYVVYALVLVLLVWRSPAPLVRLRFAMHAFDLAAFSVFIYLTRGPASPFFVYFVFSLLCATLRWQSRGTLWTGVAALAAFIAIGVYDSQVWRDPAFEFNEFIIRSASLSVLATLLYSLGACEERARREMSNLAAWPHAIPREAGELVRQLLENGAAILDAPRLLMAWEEPEEPWLNLASWWRGDLNWTREPPGRFQPLVPELLSDANFLCLDADAPLPTVLYTSSTGFKRWTGAPVHPDLQARYAINTVLSLRLHGESCRGRLFSLGKPGMTSDDLVFGEIVARHLAASIDQFYLLDRLRQAAAAEQRVRLAHELHDGVLQALTGAAIQLETVRRLLDEDPRAARERLGEIQRMIVDEQRDLRFYVHELKPVPHGSPEADLDLPARLEELGKRVESLWGLHVDVKTQPLEVRISDTLAHEIHRIVGESLINAAKHARASAVRAELHAQDSSVRITVADNGRGFSFRGHFDHDALSRLRLGPLFLKERIASLGGSLAIDSTDAGAHLEILLPVAKPGARDAH